MKVKLIVFFVLLIQCFDAYNQEGDDAYNPLMEGIMNLWTKVDIVRAINTDTDQKNLFLHELIGDLLDVYYLSRHVKQTSHVVPVDGFQSPKDEDIIYLANTIKESFQEVFTPVKGEDFYVFCYVLEKVVQVLKAPEDVKAKIAAENIG